MSTVGRFDAEQDTGERARICRVEAAWTMHPPTRALLLQLAEEYEALASRAAAAHVPEADRTGT
jgi:hypothetical protein